MPLTVEAPRIRSKKGEPAWEIAHLFPLQGHWRESDYLELETNHFIELVDGCLEVLPMPTKMHQRIFAYLFKLLCQFVEARLGGEILCAPLPVRLFPGTIREPDILYLSPSRSRRDEEYPTGADFALEIVSPDAESQNRDYVEKRSDYAKAGIPEYWIVDPQEKKITVLVLDGDAYREHGVFGPGSTATSVLLAGFSVKVDDVIAAGQGPA